MDWSLRTATAADVEKIAELRAIVLRPDLERLGRFDEHRVRQRFRDGFEPRHTKIIVVDGAFAGSIALRPADDGRWLEHFYIGPARQGQGLGEAVLRSVLDEDPIRLNVLQGSRARRLYERHGFTVEREDPIDVWMIRRSAATAR
ncbi:Predicted N-acetyltransferase YhbS [Asanoa hainanensis]|uniref:Predicted N-acetyltransferase YhbS n=1 Tax=Asanoa hainanensis TaxID=560556 RepID=A0A239NE90_9ACTN|nr:GNAT family N-acetyltransferase [Asanoa hainanensis]SNT53080.1 Predicted N-acetyltransferase YhbS [Asanoa hainanensis]